MDATFMTALNIVNVRHLKNITIPLSTTERRSIILTGKNGSGKTSVLESLENFLEFVVSSNFYTKDKCERRICELRQKLYLQALPRRTSSTRSKINPF